MAELPGRLGTLQAQDIMTDKVVVLSEDDTLHEAANTLIEQRITGAPVVNADGMFVGLLSLADLAHPKPLDEPVRHKEDPEDWRWMQMRPGLPADNAERVSQRMSRQLVSVQKTAPIVEIARIMCQGHWHRVTVVDGAGCLCGIVSTMDLLAAMVNVAEE